jgi:hypothetical protein
LKNENSSVVEKMRTRKYFLYVPLRLQKLGCRSPFLYQFLCDFLRSGHGTKKQFSCRSVASTKELSSNGEDVLSLTLSLFSLSRG